MECFSILLCKLLLRRHLPRIDRERNLEAGLEELGAASREILSLARRARQMLDGRTPPTRGLAHHPRCLLCDQEMETIAHLFTACPFSRKVWHEILSWVRLPCRLPDRDSPLHDWWLTTKRTMPKPLRKGLATITLLTPWMIWKHRNGCVFDGDQPSINRLIANIKEEAALWARAGALGLRALLPQTWDVH